MKRSGMKRDVAKAREWQKRSRTELRADPEKVKAMEQRAREKGRERAQAAPAKPRAGTRRNDRVVFRAKTPASAQACGWPGCSACGASHHHWLPQQHLRVYVRGLRLPASEADPLLRRLLSDERNTTPFCERHHGSHGTSAHEFPRSIVPVTAVAFARDLGGEWLERMLRLYPERAA